MVGFTICKIEQKMTKARDLHNFYIKMNNNRGVFCNISK